MRTLVLFVVLAVAADAAAQIRVDPEGVNVSGQGATTALFTFGRLQGYVPAEAMWCGELIPAAPDIGVKCDPSTIFGVLPQRYVRSQSSGLDGFTDIMSVPPSVARRAYEAAAAGRQADFFYVRRFVHPDGGPDQYVRVICRLTAGGARVPLSLVNVRLAFDVETPVLHVKRGDVLAPLSAHLEYTGTGRLRGRWEVVLPGQEPPSETDLLTEATLPVERRGSQRRFAEIDRFNVFLPPTGRFTLPGPEPGRLPTGADGRYLVLLRVEASNDKEADSDLAAVGAGTGIVHSGAVAGFPMPVLQYVVGAGGSENAPVEARAIAAQQVESGSDVELRWSAAARAAYFHVEIESGGQRAHEAFVRPPSTRYRLPPFVASGMTAGRAQWRVVAVDAEGRVVGKSEWVPLRVGKSE